ncbi:hypothetical protein HGRIS_013238 [Hohenbuehelia grisea]|uniref:Arrestin C-terminal-like domain-containing protein n=1 Tax=Hohenbuehelia grisea TaxID=104357 RepID=A0ABR3IV35_9AGAR
MVHLSLSSPKGNQGSRYFPYSGYLGLTPLKVEGVVRTRLDSDGKLLPAKSLTVSVKCYESRIGRVGVLHSNVLVDYTHVLWSKDDDKEFSDLGDCEYPFRIIIPAKVVGFSSTTFVDYRCMWRVEATLNHIPIAGVGNRQYKYVELPLIRHDVPPHSRPRSTPYPPTLDQQTDKPRAPRIRYCVKAPSSPVGPLDLVPVSIYMLPVDSDVSIRNASVVVERRIELFQTDCSTGSSSSLSSQTATPQPHSNSLPPSSFPASVSASSSPHTWPPSSSHNISSDSDYHHSSSTLVASSVYPSVASFSTQSETQPLIPRPSTAPLSSPFPTSTPAGTPTSEVLPSKIISTSVAGAESSGSFSRDSAGVWRKKLTFQWPAAKSNSRWAIGETIHSDLASVKFVVRVKITVSTPTGTDTLELAEQELLVVSTNEAERHLALSKYNEQPDSSLDPNGRSKSKSPRGRVRRERDSDVPPTPPARPSRPPSPSSSATSNLPKLHVGSHQLSSSSGKVKSSSRRPHTSAGPRDNVFGFGGALANRAKEAGADDSAKDVQRKRMTLDASRTRPQTPSEGIKGPSKYFFAQRMSSSSSGSKDSAKSTRSSLNAPPPAPVRAGGSPEEVKAWEEELSRIEIQSRRSSDVLGFAYKRLKRMTGSARACPA